MSRALGPTGRGVAVSVASSISFGGIYFATPLLAPASAEAIWGLRNLLTIPVIILALLAFRQWHLCTDIARRVRRKPILLLPMLVCGVLLAAQLWVFIWSPMHGRGLQVALGYFLLPLVLVLVGRLLYKDRMVWWQWLAAGVAAVGVGFEIVRVGGVSWETLLVALGYPVYFVLRRALGMGHLGGMLWEFVLLVPLALLFVVLELIDGSALAANPSLWWNAPLFSVAAGIALVFYISASRLLPMSLFGLLGYLEPALLVVASMLNGERIDPGETVIYGAIWIAVLVLVAGGIGRLRAARARRSNGPVGEPES